MTKILAGCVTYFHLIADLLYMYIHIYIYIFNFRKKETLLKSRSPSYSPRLRPRLRHGPYGSLVVARNAVSLSAM